MPDTAGAQFEEMLEVGVDVGVFENGLRQLETVYADFLSRIQAKGGSGAEVFQVGAVGTLSKDLAELASVIGQIQTNLSGTLKDITQGVVTTLESFEKTIEDKFVVSSKAKMEQSKVEADSRIEDARRVNKALADEAAVARAESGSSFDGRGVSKNFAIEEELAGDKKLAVELERLLALEFDRQAAIRKTTESAVASAEKQAELAEKQLRRRQEAEGQFMLNKGPQATQPSMLGGIVSDVGGLTEFFLKMQASLIIIQAMVLPFQEIASLIKSGWEYMTNLQKSAADLQGLIANNVVLSKDFETNFKLAGEAAVDVTKQLQDFSVKTGIEVTQLNSAFKAVVDGGGAAFVTQMSQLGTLAEYFAISVKATGKDFQVQRTLISEIPSLLDGTVTKSSLILRTLGLTKDAWEALRKDAEEHKNLVTQLEPLLKPFLTVAQQSELRMAAVNEQLDLMKNRVSAAIITPLWETWLSILQDALHWLEQNKNEIEAVGTSITNLAKDIAELVSNTEGLSVFSTIFHGFAKDAAILAFSLDAVVNKFKDYREDKALQDALDDAKSKRDITAITKAQNAIDDAAASRQVRDMKNLDRLEDAVSPSSFPRSANDQAVLGGKNPPAQKEDHLKEVESQYREELKLIQDYFERRKKLQDEALKLGNIGEEQHYENLKNLQNAELERLKILGEEYSKKADNSGGKSPSIGNFKNSIDKSQDSAETGVFNQRIKNEEQFAAFKKKLSDIDFKDNLAMIESVKKAELAAAQQNGSSKKGLIARLDKEALDQEYKDYEDNVKRQLALSTTTETQKATLSNELMRKSFEQKAKDDIADAKISKADLADNIKIAKDLSTQAHQDFNLEVQRVGESDKHKFNQKEILKDQKDLAKEYSGLIAQDIKRLGYLIEQAEKVAEQTHDTTELVRLEKERADLQKEQEAANNNVTTGAKEPGTAGKTIESITGLNDKDLTDGFKDFKTGLLTAAKGLGGLTQTISSLINAYKQGAANGGVLGGIGGVAGQVGGMISAIPGGELIGGAIQGVGQIMGFIGGFFTAAAKRIAEEMKKSFDQIVKNYQNGTTNLVDTISQLEQKRQEAISRLSGQKGGQDQLKQLLPQFDDEIASLKKQQKEMLDAFANSLTVLELHSDALGSLLKTWQDINKQVTDYLGAGGDAAKAAEFLSLSLEKQRESAQTDLAEGESQAIQDAINLNGLLKQRVDLVKQFKQQEFDLLNADSIERRQAGSVTRGQQLAQLRQQNQEQLDSLDQQISLTTRKVDLERQVFDISSDINALHRRDEELQLSALSVQISKWKDLQTIISGIVKSIDGTSFALSGNLAAAIGAVTTASNVFSVNVGGVTINGPTTGGGAAIGSDIGDAITLSLQQGVHRLLIA